MLNDPIELSQKPVEEIPDILWDVIIVGAGPAGAIAAAFLAERGHKTLLLDKDQFPREKVCGDGLNHDSIRFLNKIGLLETIRSFGHEVPSSSVYSCSGIELEVPGPYITLKRSIFDSILTCRAVKAGAAFFQANVMNIQNRNNFCEVRIAGKKKNLCGHYVILSTGANIVLAKSLHILEKTYPSAVSVRCYVRSKERIDRFIGSYDKSVLPGYGWIFPMGNNIYNMGVIAFYSNGRKPGKKLTKRFQDFIKQFPVASRVMQSGEMISPLLGAPLRCGLPNDIKPGIGNLIATGETIGTTFNFTGEGIGKAMETGELAAKVIQESLSAKTQDIVQIYQEKLNNIYRPKYKGYITAEKWLSIPWLNDFIARRVVKSKFLKRSIIDIIAQEIDPRTVFSVGAIMKSFWS